jgi:hypothetical protein
MRGARELLREKRLRSLQHAVEGLPVESRRAMLEGLGDGPIIAGAYSVGAARCPGLAAYRHGARTGYSDFARAWDRYAHGRGVRRVRNDDLSTLVTMLRASVAAEGDLDMPAAGAAIDGVVAEPQPARERVATYR